MRTKLQIPSILDGAVWAYANAASLNQRHTHAELELNLVTRGCGTYIVGSRRYRIGRGDLIWLFPAQEHVLFEQSSDFSMSIAVFRRRAVRGAAVSEQFRVLLRSSLTGEVCRRLQGDDLRRLDAGLRELLEAGASADLLNAGLRYTLLSAWQAFQRARVTDTREMHPAVERATRLLADGVGTGSLTALARGSGLSPTRLSRLFKQQTGLALTDFRSRLRLDRFVEIYGAATQRSMLDAALEAGFGSYPQFHRVFTRVMGRSPREYRGSRRR